MADAAEDPPTGEENAGVPGDAARDLQSAEAGAPEAPVLHGPKEEALVDGTDVTLRWESMAEADRYLVEVAEDTQFHEILVQEEVEGSSLALRDLPTDGELYYWRVVTQRGGEWSHGDRIESFVSVTGEQARTAEDGGNAPDQGEGYGPAAELVTAAGAEATAEATGDEERFAREREMGVAHEGVESGQIIGLAGAVIVAIVIIVCVLFFWITSVARTTRNERTAESVYPELQATETRAAQQLDQYELVSERDSSYRIPIGEAMRIVADEAYTQGRRQGDAQGENRRNAEGVRLGLPAARFDSLAPGASVPASSAPEGPAGTPQN